MNISQLGSRITGFARTALMAAKQKNQKPEPRLGETPMAPRGQTLNQKPSAPLALASIIRPQARERWLLPQVGAITPQYIEMTLRGALAGAHIPQWELFNLMEDTWPRLRKNIFELKMAVRNRRPVFEAYREEDEEESPAATERMKLVSAALRKMQPDPAADEGGFDDMVFDILDAWFKGVSVLEIDWHVTQTQSLGRFVAPRCTRWANPVHYAWDENLRLGLAGIEDDRSQIANGKPRSQQPNLPSAISHRPSPLSPFPADRFLVAKCKTKSGSILGGALLRPLVWWWCAANFSADWLLNLAQIFGLPFRWATYEPTAPQETVDRICAMLQNMGSAGWAAFPAGTSLELKADGQKSGAQTPQGDMLDRADKQCDLLVLGQTLTTDTGGMGSGGGSHALGQVHADVRSGIIDAAAKFTAGVIEQQLIPAILRLNYGEAEEAPTLTFQERTEANLAEKAAILAQLHAAGAGSIIPLDWLGKTFGIPKPKDGEATLADAKPRAAATMPDTSRPLSKSLAARLAQLKEDALWAFNPNHDPQDGRFTSGIGGSAGPNGPTKTAEECQKEIEQLRKKISLYKTHFRNAALDDREMIRKAIDDAEAKLANEESSLASFGPLKKEPIEQPAPPQRQDGPPRPNATDILANYYKEQGTDSTVRDKKWVRRYIGGRTADEIEIIEKKQETAKSDAEWNELEDRLNTCALRLSIAFNKSGFPIPEGLESVYPSYDEVRPNKKDVDRNNVKKDAYQKKMHYYISNAEEFGAYLKSVLGKPDITVAPEEGGDRVLEIQRNLSPGEVALFARKFHSGIFTKSYMDPYVTDVIHPMDIWILKSR